jgi:predicted nucleotidyltransferase component of viral defense system
MQQLYRGQVSLLLDVLPEVAKDERFALHGGTAINLFVQNMPRISVDIDLTYKRIEDRELTLKNINEGLLDIKAAIDAIKPSARVVHQREKCKLQIEESGAQIKIEVNMVGRGIWGGTERRQLCPTAQEEFDAFCAIETVSLGQLYGGKICAALDRQQPRDLFDVKLLLGNEGFTDEIKHGFILSLVSSPRPIHEILDPRFQDQQQAFENQFVGMTEIPFTYADFKETRDELTRIVGQSMDSQDTEFLISMAEATPVWSAHPFQEFPAVRWKLQNLENLKAKNPEKFEEQKSALTKLLH